MRWQTIYEARWIFGVLIALAFACSFITPWLAIVFALFILYTFYFFRDPERLISADADTAVAAADGVVVDVIDMEEPDVVKGPMRRIAIFLSVFDVHTNRAPVAGTIIHSERRVGKMLDARHPDATRLNECRTWGIESAHGVVVVRQITGAIARRIVAWAQVGQTVAKGERFGMIRFGSRTEVYLPLTAEVLVKAGDRVQGGGDRHCAPAVMNPGMKPPIVLKQDQNDPNDPPIYLLPNLMTAGNLFCGFAATLKIIAGTLVAVENSGSIPQIAIDRYHEAIWFILAACVFDLLDGRVARFGGFESPFGREFDSLADIVSFGIAPALLVYKIVLEEFPRAGLIIAFVYLACGALRLARFNCIAAAVDASGEKAHADHSKNFKGFPIPAAAGVIASLTEFLLWMDEGNREIGVWKFALPVLMLLLAFMMFSRFRYPSFKAINWRTKRSLPAFLIIIVLLTLTALFYQWMPAVIFLSYLLYGFLRPWISRSWRREIEQEIGEDPDDETPEGGEIRQE